MKYKVLVEAPYLTQSGYGEHSRLILNALKDNDELDIYGVPLPWGQTSWISDDTESRQWLDDISLKTSQSSKQEFDLHVFVGMPVEFTKKAHKAVCVTAGIEVDRVDPKWLIKSYEIDKIIVPSQHSKSVFVNSGYKNPEEEQQLEVQCPVEVIPYSNRKFSKSNTFKLNLGTKFNFLTVAQWGPRKNLENMISWFVDEFKNNKEVGLILKTGMARNCNMDRMITEMAIKNTLKQIDPEDQRKCKVYLLHGDLSEGELADLYSNKKIKGLISATHGEGFGLPLFEAACHGVPVIATDATGHVDFLYKSTEVGQAPHFLPVEFTVNEVPPQAVWEGVIPPGSKWYFPDSHSFKSQLRELYKNYTIHKSVANELSRHLEETHSTKKINNLINESVMSLLDSDLDELDVRTLR